MGLPLVLVVVNEAPDKVDYARDEDEGESKLVEETGVDQTSLRKYWLLEEKVMWVTPNHVSVVVVPHGVKVWGYVAWINNYWSEITAFWWRITERPESLEQGEEDTDNRNIEKSPGQTGPTLHRKAS